ncbi:MAG: hypothetical protein KDG55_03425 [Rhodocyclaceae bacterium]|nr:hypothetical protein [Rhodocyclaceae bacterium]
MKASPAMVLRIAAVVAVAALYYWLSHVLTAADRPSTGGALLSLGPYMAVALVMAWRARHRVAAVGGWLLVVLAIASQWQILRSNFSWIYLCQHAGAFTLLAIGFGRTLGAGAKPMIAGFAERIHGPLPAALAQYTRQATLAWTVFFTLMATSSPVLFFVAPIAWWSAYANLLTPALIGLMFVAEYVARQRLPRECRTGFIASIRASLVPRPAATERECDLGRAKVSPR